ncbi:MAG: trypsin-like peptidase domain-containing protein [Nanoarchaeota archaeon]
MAVYKDHWTKRYFVHVIILILLILFLQLIFSVTLYFKLNKTNNNLEFYQSELNKKIDIDKADTNSKINELSETIFETSRGIKEEISEIKAKASADFSGIIEQSVESVISIRTNVAQGTGFIITEDGYVVTNAHVLSGGRYAKAITSEKEVKSMSLIGYNEELDIALLKIDGEYKFLEFEETKNVAIGEKVIAIGNPLGLSFSVSEGIVSGKNRLGINEIPAYIQTDAALNPGSSGGPLINTEGKVIGINNFKIAGENLGFALESDYVVETINEIASQALNQTIIR